jgi:hypothetical protein
MKSSMTKLNNEEIKTKMGKIEKIKKIRTKNERIGKE